MHMPRMPPENRKSISQERITGDSKETAFCNAGKPQERRGKNGRRRK